MRSCGVLLHISSLPSKYGIGTLGREAFQFVDFLVRAGQEYWQILPVGPTTIGDSPYQAFSAFAGNPLLIDLELLIEDGLLKEEEVEGLLPDIDDTKVDYKKQFEGKYALLQKAYQIFKSKQDETSFETFKNNQKAWLEDYSLYMALKYHNDQLPWNQWEEELKHRNPEAISKYKELLKDEIDYWCYVQYLFFLQWTKLREYANEQGVKIIGDIPIYVSYDSADVWANPELFELDKELNPIRIAGCPPDDTFSKTGQLWGNPIYNWEALKKTDYAWWIERIRFSMELFDTLRIDHFRGFDSFYAIPFGHPTAEFGEWVEGPGTDFFAKVKEKLGEISIIAEDLGFTTDSVKQLLEFTGYPGMNVLEFAFSKDQESNDMPHNFKKHSVTYIGTHDNDTCLGYINSLDNETRRFIQKYLNVSSKEECVWGMIRAAYASVSDLVIIQMQDFLGLDSEARMNYPSKTAGNWIWRLQADQIDKNLEEKINTFSKTYFRKQVQN